MTPSLPEYLVFGEALTDFIRQDDGSWQAHPGGACWNVARVGARLGVATAFAGSVSQDIFGSQLAQLSCEAGLDARYLQQLPHSPLLAMVPSTRPPRYFFVGDDSADLHFDPSLLPEGWQAAARIVHFGCISLARPPLADRLVELALSLAAAGKRIAFDPNFRAPMASPGYRAVFAAIAAVAHCIKVSDEDLAGLFPGLDPAAALAELRVLAPQAELLLTRGAEGMTLLHGGHEWVQPAFAVTVRDTVGCGDAAMGGWMASRLLQPGADVQTHLRYAAATAACAAAHTGAYAPTRAEVETLLEGGR
ncbi:carbohydrate kinase family protein [Paludibacterium yongneupense]|uniref:carbohydrate kinase family protein n=1 Tax=Paludibacterium yongneupense TaxID=400061 RepID=UPI000415C67F|nr:carbohydrate kinase [Paludibacterium yongneupense]